MESTESIEIFYFLFAGTLAMLLLSVGIVAFVLLYQRKLYYHQLKLQEMETIYQKKLVQSNLEEVENERIRISKDLHDEIGSIFSALNIKLDQLTDSVSPLSKESQKTLEDSKETIDLGIKSIRRISHNMVPPSLEMFGLIAALEDLCLQFEGGPSGLPIELIAAENLSEPSKKVSLVIFRIVQELIQNTFRHSGATKVELELKNTNDGLLLIYRDNGKGFLPDDRENRKGIGLLNIESRANILRANLNIESAPQKGVQVTILIPHQNTHNSYAKNY